MNSCPEMGFGRPLPGADLVRREAASLAEAARKEWEAWEQDADGMDPELGAGGICQDVASAMAERLAEIGCEHVMHVHSAVGENHVFLVALLEDGVYSVDVPPSVYETGSGYVWKKREDAEFGPESVVVERVEGPMSPEDFEARWSD